MDEQEWTGGRGDHRAEDAAMKGSISGPYPDRVSICQNVHLLDQVADDIETDGQIDAREIFSLRSPGARQAVESPPGNRC